jgi:Family of unknown function (DUF6527)
MKLVDLEPFWCADWDDGSHRRSNYDLTLATAQGVLFDCPKCRAPQGSHSILVWFRDRGVPDDAEPGAARPEGHEKSPQGRPAQRWTAAGTGFDDLTLKPSIALEGGCAWHGFVTNGEAA